MKTIIIKNLSTIKDHIVVEIISDLLLPVPELNEYVEKTMKHFRLKYRVKDDEMRGRVTYTVTDDDG